jgi:serine/threonine protein phosphatase PrpC
MWSPTCSPWISSLDDMLLLTSDGLTRYAKPEDIARIATTDADLATICHGLIEHAKQGGGADNITCMMLRVVEVAPADATEPPTPLKKLNSPPLLLSFNHG